MREDPPLEVTVATVVAERQASAGARDGVKGQRRSLAARAPLDAPVRRSLREKTSPRRSNERSPPSKRKNPLRGTSTETRCHGDP